VVRKRIDSKGTAMHLFMPAAERVLQENGLSIPVKQSVLGENAALVGAVYG
jgi:hypothetical protein